MPWELDTKAPKMERNDLYLVCYGKESPAEVIVLNPTSGVAEISFNQIINDDGISSSASKSALLAISAIKILNMPYEIKPQSFIYIDYKIKNYRENLPKLIVYIDPDNKNGLSALLDDIGALDPVPAPLSQGLSQAAPKHTSSKSSKSSKAVFFSESVEIYKDIQANKGPNLIKKEDENERLKTARTGSKESCRSTTKSLKKYE